MGCGSEVRLQITKRFQMKNKPTPVTQVRLEVEVARDVRVMWTSYEARTSLTAFTNMLIRDGMEVRKGLNVWHPPIPDTSESTFKK